MLIKIGNEWINPNYIESVETWNPRVYERKSYYVDVNMADRDHSYRIATCDTYEEAVETMDEAAEKINAAQGCKPAAGEKTTMKYEEHGDEAIVGVYRCSRCKTVIRDEHSWYKFCPVCGREIERWE